MENNTKERIVSLLPSNTETICALGFGDMLVGRSHGCNYPEWVKSLPSCSRSKIDICGTSAEVDGRVQIVLENALSVYAVEADTLNSISPTLIITQDHCEVCAVSLKDVEEAVCNLISSKPRIISIRPNTLEDVFSSFRTIASAIGDESAADKLISQINLEILAIEDKIKDLNSPKPRVAELEWIDPLFTSGSWIPELVSFAGGVNVVGEKGVNSKRINFEYLEKSKPDVIVIAPCGYGIAKALEDLGPLVNHPRWNTLKAVQNKQVYIADGNQYFNRPGPRILDSIKILAEILHPKIFDFGYKNKAWVKLDEVAPMA